MFQISIPMSLLNLITKACRPYSTTKRPEETADDPKGLENIHLHWEGDDLTVSATAPNGVGIMILRYLVDNPTDDAVIDIPLPIIDEFKGEDRPIGLEYDPETKALAVVDGDNRLEFKDVELFNEDLETYYPVEPPVASVYVERDLFADLIKSLPDEIIRIDLHAKSHDPIIFSGTSEDFDGMYLPGILDEHRSAFDVARNEAKCRAEKLRNT